MQFFFLLGSEVRIIIPTSLALGPIQLNLQLTKTPQTLIPVLVSFSQTKGAYFLVEFGGNLSAVALNLGLNV